MKGCGFWHAGMRQSRWLYQSRQIPYSIKLIDAGPDRMHTQNVEDETLGFASTSASPPNKLLVKGDGK